LLQLLTLPVLMYHRVAKSLPPGAAAEFVVSDVSFAMQMRQLAERGYQVVSLRHLTRARPLPRRVAITFDDAYLDTYTHAFPILKHFGFTATVFVVTGLVGKESAWSATIRVPLADWDQLRDMAAHGISIQSHTCTHPDLTVLPDDAVLRELRDSAGQIEEMVGSPADCVAYPYGKVNPRICRLAQEAGYRSGWTAGLGNGSDYAQERIRVTDRDQRLMFSIKTNRWAGLIRRLRHGQPNGMRWVPGLLP